MADVFQNPRVNVHAFLVSNGLESHGTDFSNLNIEALLKVNVIGGRTGAPSILAVHAR
jgi:hypothetical protein